MAVADICRCLHNYNAVLDITSAFNRSAIFRLKKTWMKVSKPVSASGAPLPKLRNWDRGVGKGLVPQRPFYTYLFSCFSGNEILILCLHTSGSLAGCILSPFAASGYCVLLDRAALFTPLDTFLKVLFTSWGGFLTSKLWSQRERLQAGSSRVHRDGFPSSAVQDPCQQHLPTKPVPQRRGLFL